MMKMGEIGGPQSVTSREFWLATAEVCKRLEELPQSRISKPEYSIEDVEKLTNRTGCSRFDCMRTLATTHGDFDKAVELLSDKRG